MLFYLFIFYLADSDVNKNVYEHIGFIKYDIRTSFKLNYQRLMHT